MTFDLKDLPDIAREIVELIGFDDTMKLVNVYGGTYLTISAQPRQNIGTRRDVIEGLLGRRKAELFFARFAGTPIYLPRCTDALKGTRNRAICADYDAGVPMVMLMAKYGIGERQIKRILKESPDKGE